MNNNPHIRIGVGILNKKTTYMANNNQQVQNLKLDIAPDVARGTYSNLAIITHSPTEIILDFAQMMPGTQNPTVRERIVMNPIHAKRLLNALTENISKFEQNFGVIEEPMPMHDGNTVPYNLLGKA